MVVKISRLLIALIIVLGFTVSIFHEDTNLSSNEIEVQYNVSEYEYPRIGAIEAMGSYINPWGGVASAVGALHNNTHYNYDQYTSLDTIVKRQMEEEDGYVARATLTMQSHATYLNGKLGSPIAILELDVHNIVNIDDSYNYSYTELNSNTIITLADEVVAEYEASLNIDFIRLTVLSSSLTSIAYPYIYGGYYGPLSYTVIYVSLLTSTSSISTFQSRISELGGFMDLADPSIATSWPNQNLFISEIYMPAAIPTDYTVYPYFFNVLYLYSFSSSWFPRSSIEPWEFQSAVFGQAGFYTPGYIQNSAGEESYSFRQHVGYSNNIKNKMSEDSSCESMSIIGGASPSHNSIDGIPSSWEVLDEEYPMPQSYLYPNMNLPAGPISGWAEVILSHYPRIYAESIDYSLLYLDNTMFDYLVDSLWANTIPPIDYAPLIRNFNWSDAFPSGCLDMNYDLMTAIMLDAGMTPSSLTSRIDAELAESDPGWAIVKAFIDYFDSYHLLDFLDNDVYADPVALGDFIDQLVESVTQIFKEQGGIDLPSEFRSKEAIATFVNEHWDITLQALWNALASFDGDTTGIKDAFHSILDSENLREHITPFLRADFSRPISAGMGFVAAVNFNLTNLLVPQTDSVWEFYGVDTTDIRYNFELLPDSIEGDAPYLFITKSTPNRVVDEGAVVPFTITVKNLGSESAYDIKVLDGMSSGFDGEREFYWTKDLLTSGEEWTIEYDVTGSESGLYVDLPVLCVYFNTSLDTFDLYGENQWDGSALYTISAPAYHIQIGSSPFNFGALNVSTIITVGSLGVIVVVIVLWIKEKR